MCRQRWHCWQRRYLSHCSRRSACGLAMRRRSSTSRSRLYFVAADHSSSRPLRFLSWRSKRSARSSRSLKRGPQSQYGRTSTITDVPLITYSFLVRSSIVSASRCSASCRRMVSRLRCSTVFTCSRYRLCAMRRRSAILAEFMSFFPKHSLSGTRAGSGTGLNRSCNQRSAMNKNKMRRFDCYRF